MTGKLAKNQKKTSRFYCSCEINHVHNMWDLDLVALRETLCSLKAASRSALAKLVPERCVMVRPVCV